MLASPPWRRTINVEIELSCDGLAPVPWTLRLASAGGSLDSEATPSGMSDMCALIERSYQSWPRLGEGKGREMDGLAGQVKEHFGMKAQRHTGILVKKDNGKDEANLLVACSVGETPSLSRVEISRDGAITRHGNEAEGRGELW